MLKTILTNKLFWILTAGMIIRILAAPLPGLQSDTSTWFAWAIRLENFDFSHFYSKDYFSDYTPGYLYVLSLLGFLRNLLVLPDNIFYLLLKIPAITAELIIGLLVYKEARKYTPEITAIIVSSAILFNPALIFNSAVWGQIDSILTLLILATVIALKRNYLILSSVFFGLALLVKPQAIAIAPLIIFYFIKHFRISSLLKLILPGFITVSVLAFAFFPDRTLKSLTLHIINTANEYPYTSVNAYNSWGVIGFWVSDQIHWNALTYQRWGYVLMAIYWLILGYFYFKKKLSAYALAAFATMGFFFLPTRVHERYLYPAIIFLILTISLLRSKLLLVLTVLLSLLHLFNLYYIYVYYNEVYLKLPKILYNPILYNFLGANNKSLSLISTVIFILISITLIKYDSFSKKT